MSRSKERKCGSHILGKELGSGGYGIVYSVKKKNNKSTPTVIKLLCHKSSCTDNEESDEPVNKFESLIEIDVLFRLKSSSLVKGIELYEPSDCTNIKSAAIEMESLNDFRHLILSTKIDPMKKILFIYRMAVGIKCLHDNKILHLDIKPANVLYSSDAQTPFLKISDYGLSYQVDNIKLGFNTPKLFGTRKYRPPEISGAVKLSSSKYKKIYNDPNYSKQKDINNIKFNYNNKFDIWSLGISAIYILQSSPDKETILDKWDDLNHNDFYENIKKMFSMPRKKIFLESVIRPLGLSENIEKLLLDLLMKILILDPARRLDIDEVIEHDLFKIAKIVPDHPSKKLHDVPIKKAAVAIYKLYEKEEFCEEEDQLICNIKPLTDTMKAGIKYIIAAFKGPLKNFYIRDLFFALDIYIRVIVACYSNSWAICRKIAILAIRIAFRYYNRSEDFELEKHNDESFALLEAPILKLFKGNIRISNVYDYTEYASELKVYFDKLIKEDYDAFNYYFVIDYTRFRKAIRRKYDLERQPSKVIYCEEFFNLEVSKKPIEER
jgi:serine/threonine protein kinase